MIEEQVIYRDVISFMDRSLAAELRRQGHRNTGNLENSLGGRIYRIPNGYQLKGSALYYAGILNDGVRPDRVPFNLSGNGGQSKYINALIAYFKHKGLSEKEAKRAAFATAIKQKKEGIPTQGSQKYSQTGFRTNFILSVEKATRLEIKSRILNGCDAIVQKTIHKIKSGTF